MDDLTETHPFALVPIEITISVGKARPLVRDLMRLQKDTVLVLDRRIEDPVEIYVGDRLILRQAIGLQQAPPNMLIVSLSMFLTWFVMDPVLQEAWQAGIGPFSRGEMELQQAFPLAMQPVRVFLAARLDPDTFAALLDLRPGFEGAAVDAPLSLLVPSFMLSEIQRAFEVGFLIYLPFLVIDMVVSAILMSMGMMMLPPVMISLPFKLLLFVLVDGWALIITQLVGTYT